MILKVNDTPVFNLRMMLNINYDLEYIEITISLWNKAKNTKVTKTFPADNFSAALQCYEMLNKFYM